MTGKESQKIILVVDDNPVNIAVAKGVLAPKYLVQAATGGAAALHIIENKQPDLILLDIMMPEKDGYEVLKQIKANPDSAQIPVIFLTAMTEETEEEIGLKLGAADYITKPLSPPILLARIETHLVNYEAKKLLQNQTQMLEQKVQERTEKLSKMQDVAMLALGALAESRDPETGNHLRRTQGYVRSLATHLGQREEYKEAFTAEKILLISKSAPLHDIGKVGVPDHILLKPGKLTAEEFEEIKKHPGYAKDALEVAITALGADDNFLHYALDIAYGHHEKWDGTGYPQKLKGEQIPLVSRLMALADVYDALVSKRSYKEPMSHETAVSIILEGKGSHFDPAMVEGFIEIQKDYREIAKKYCDGNS